MRLVVAFFYTQFHFLQKYSLDSSIKIAQDCSKSSNGDSEDYLGFFTLLQRPEKSLLARMVEINGGIDVCGKSLKTRFTTVFSFFLTF